MAGAASEIRRIGRDEVEPLLDGMRADDLLVLPDEGVWLGAVAEGRVVGAARIFDRDGHAALDDVWVEPAHRRRGLATALIDAAAERVRPLWLICDEPDIGFYARRGFFHVGRDEFPPALAAHYRAKREWPADVDHEHFAMRRD